MVDNINKKQEEVGNTKEEKSQFKLWEKKALKEKQGIMQSQNYKRTGLNNDRNKMDEDRFVLLEDLRKSKVDIEKVVDSMKIFKEVIDERKRFLRGSYLMKGQDDLEQTLETLFDHFKLIKLTSFEELARNNQLNLSVS